MVDRHKLRSFFALPRRAARWLFVDRSTDRIVIAQWPNLLLWLYIALLAARTFFKARAGLPHVLDIASALVLALWALDEIARGVNPWRRMLGAAVLIGLTVARLG